MLLGMTTLFTITTGSRLHLGPLAVGAESGRRFGGVGLMIDQPGYQLSTIPDSEWCIDGPAEVVDRVGQFVRRLQPHLPKLSPQRLTVLRAGPSHSGLGSGTQLGLAVARLLVEAHGSVLPPVASLATLVGRGQRSALGVHGFVHGGFLVEGGKRTETELGALAARIDFPDDWRIVLVKPPRAVGLSGTAELQAFAALSPMSRELTAELCRIVVMELLPSLAQHDFPEFADAVGHFSLLVGDYFAPQQGGWFADRRMEQLATELAPLGWTGVAQSSWGPTIAVFCRSQTEAECLTKDVLSMRPWIDCETQIVRGLNHGATMSAQ